MPQPPWFSHNKKCFNGQYCESERGMGGSVSHPAQRVLSSALYSSNRHSEDGNKRKGRLRLSWQFGFFFFLFHFQLSCTSFLFTQGLSPPVTEIRWGLFFPFGPSSPFIQIRQCSAYNILFCLFLSLRYKYFRQMCIFVH